MPLKKKKQPQNDKKIRKRTFTCIDRGRPYYELPPVLGYKDHCLTKYCSPAWSITGRPPSKEYRDDGPPYYYPTYPRHEGFTLGGRHRPIKIKNDGPEYYPLPLYVPSPAFSIKSRPKEPKREILDIKYYDVPNPTGPAFTFGRRIPIKEKIDDLPPPRLYEWNGPRSPAFSFYPRYTSRVVKDDIPYYNPVNPDKGKAFSFGRKHNPCFLPYITSCDKFVN